MNDYVAGYLICGIAYAIVMEYQYRTSDEFDSSDCWWLGELVGCIVQGIYNTAFWPKCIIDEMLDVYNSSHDDDEDI